MRFQSAATSRRGLGVLETCDTKLVLLNFYGKPVLPSLILPSLITLRVAGTAVNPMNSQDFNSEARVVTGLRPVGESTNSSQRARKRSPTPTQPKTFRHAPKRKTTQKLKIAWRLCYSRKPFRELCPRMRTPEKGSNGGLQYWMPSVPAKTQQVTQTLIHLSST